jgi:hypothetical protein
MLTTMGNITEPTKRQQAERQQAEAKRQAHVAAYAENARQWWASSRRYYVAQFNHGGTTAGWTDAFASSSHDVSGLLEAIEDIGWVLHDIGYVYQPITQRSNMLTDSANMTGIIVGIYTFKRPPPRPD